MKHKSLLLFTFISLLLNSGFQNITYGQLNQAMKKYERAKAVQGTKKGKKFNTYSVGYGIAFTNFDYQHTYNIYDEFHQYLGEDEFSHHFNSKGLSIVANSYTHISELNNNLDLNLNFGVNVNSFIETTPQYEIPNNIYTIGITHLSVAFPLGLELVKGGLASMNKNDKTSLTFGFGAAPIIQMSNIGNETKMKLDVAPYFNITAGFFAAIQWQFYLEYFSGNSRIAKIETSTGLVTVDRSRIITLGLRIAPFSFLWDDRF